jgi:hypothetical protein
MTGGVFELWYNLQTDACSGVLHLIGEAWYTSIYAMPLYLYRELALTETYVVYNTMASTHLDMRRV